MPATSNNASIASSRTRQILLRQLKREVDRSKSLQEALETSKCRSSHLLENSRRLQEQLRRLSHDLLSAQEEERKRISRDLHDQVGQTLTAINVKLTTLNQAATVNASGLKLQLAGTQRLLETSMSVVHRFARELRPPQLDDLGLTAALRSLMTGFTKRTNIPIHAKVSAAVDQLNDDRKTVLYRVAQEALTNVGRHAQASLVRVSIQRVPGTMRMEIHDNGRSFRVDRVLGAKKPARLGLLGMRERVEMVGGTFSVDSAPGAGTTIRVQIPFRDGPKKAAAGRIESRP